MRFLAVILAGLSLIAPAAHLLEMPNKIGLVETEYFIVQQIYSGWWMVGLLLPLAFLANIANALRSRADKSAMTLWAAAAVLIASNLIISRCSPSPQIAQRRTGRCCPKTGRRCGGNGNTPTPSTRSSASWRSTAPPLRRRDFLTA